MIFDAIFVVFAGVIMLEHMRLLNTSWMFAEPVLLQPFRQVQP